MDKLRKAKEVFKNLYFHYQPIVNIKTGEIFGYEALVRGFNNLGFKNPPQLFDYAYQEGFLFHLDLALRELAIHEFIENFKMGHRLFFNLDCRVIFSKDFKKGETLKILESLGVPPSMLVFEVSESFEMVDESIQKVIRHYKEQGFEVALDDFGVGHVCLEAVYKLSPNYIKVDKFFIDGLSEDILKKEIVVSLKRLCERLNIKVIAEGIETEKEVYTLDDLGIPLLQGYFIKEPSQLNNLDKLEIKVKFKRREAEREINIKNYLRKSITVTIYDDASILASILENKKNLENLENIIVLDKKEHPLAFISFKKLALLLNNDLHKNLFLLRRDKKVYDLSEFFEPIITIDIANNFSIKIVENLLENIDKDYFVITENLKFLGVIHYKDLIKIVLKERLLEYLDKSPLTKLPGKYGYRKVFDNFYRKQKRPSDSLF